MSSHPFGSAMRAEIVQQQNLGFERGAIGFLVRGAGSRVVTGTNAVQQILVIEEDAFVAAVQQFLHRGDGQMSLARAGLADQQEAGVVRGRKILDEALDLDKCSAQARGAGIIVLDIEVLQRGALIVGRNASRILEGGRKSRRRAGAALRAGEAGTLHYLPPGAFADGTNGCFGHAVTYFISNSSDRCTARFAGGDRAEFQAVGTGASEAMGRAQAYWKSRPESRLESRLFR